jgi:hypothetical protein
VIIGVTDEAVGIVDKWYASRKKTGYPIAILDGALEKALGVPHFPYSGVIDPEGVISYAGNSPESALKAAMKAASGGSMWPKKLAAAAKLLGSGKLAEAWAELQDVKASGGLDEREQHTCERFSAYVSETSEAIVKLADELFKKDMIYAAVEKLEPIANAKPALPASEAAQKLFAELQALPDYDAELKGGKIFANAVALEEDKEYLDAFNGFKDVIKKAPGTKIAGVAQSSAESLIHRGMPGYAPACPKCMQAKKACEKHSKTVKL